MPEALPKFSPRRYLKPTLLLYPSHFCSWRGQLLATENPIKRPGWWKGNFALFWMLATWGTGKANSLTPYPDNQWVRAFIGERGGYMQKQHSQVTVIWATGHAVIWPASSWLLLSTWLLLFLELLQLRSRLQSGHPAVNFFNLMRVSVSIRQLTGHGSEYYLQPSRRT